MLVTFCCNSVATIHIFAMKVREIVTGVGLINANFPAVIHITFSRNVKVVLFKVTVQF